MLNLLIPKLHREGYRFVAISAVVTFIFLLINNYLGVLGLIFTIWVYYFFRDPDRFSIKNENYLLSPADGKITQIVEINGALAIAGSTFLKDMNSGIPVPTMLPVIIAATRLKPTTLSWLSCKDWAEKK